MAKKSGGANRLGSWAFLIGVVLAVLLGLFGPLSQTWILILVVLGLIVGFLNVTEEETQPFLFSGTVLIIASAFGAGVLDIVPTFSNIFSAILAIFVPATIIVAIKHVFSLARN